MPSPEACADEFTRDLLEDRNGWKAVALANQATAQSHQARWVRAEAALQAIVDLGGAYGSQAWMAEADRIAREALAQNREPK